MWLLSEDGSRGDLQKQIDREISELITVAQAAKEAVSLAEENLKTAKQTEDEARTKVRQALRQAADQGFRISWDLMETFNKGENNK